MARVPIGEFSIMTGLSRKALRHYHDLGLLAPAQVDPATGYRFYDTAQVATAQVIRQFRGLGMPVPEVKAMLAAGDSRARNQVITAHLLRMESELDRVRDAVGALRQLLDPVPLNVEFRNTAPIRAASISATVTRDELGSWWKSAFAELRATVHGVGPEGGLYAPELFSEEAGEVTIFIPVDAGVEPEGRVCTGFLPPAELAIAVHDGPHQTAGPVYAALGTYVVEHGLAIAGPVRENYLVAPERTEIGWPIRRTPTPSSR